MKPVLYAEDDLNDVFFMQRAWRLAEIPNPLIHVENGEAAIAYLAGNDPFADRGQHPLPCLLIVDLKMPGRNGFEVLQWVRRDPELVSLKAVLISASNQEIDLEVGRKLGILDYVVKTPAVKSLVHTLQDKKAFWLGNPS